MVGRTNAGGGGNTIAFINVTYPSGSTCTCTNGTKTLRAKGTSGSYTFSIPETGSWTVSCTDGTDSASNIVTVTSGGVYNVYLSYYLYLYKTGDTYDTVTGGWGAGYTNGVVPTVTYDNDYVYGYGKGTSSSGSNGNQVTLNTINITNYSTLVANYLSYSISGSGTGSKYIYAGVTSSRTNTRTAYDAVAAFTANDTDPATLTVDVSSLIGSYYVGFGLQVGANLTGTYYLSELYLIP